MPLHKDLEEAADNLNEAILEFEDYLVSREYSVPARVQMPTEERDRADLRYLAFRTDPIRHNEWGLYVEENSKNRVSCIPLANCELRLRCPASRLLPALLKKLEVDSKADVTVVRKAAEDLKEFLDNLEKSNAR